MRAGVRHLSSCVRLRERAVYTCRCPGCGAVREQTSPVLSLWRGFFCDRRAALVTAEEPHRLPALSGSNQRAAAPATLFRPPGHPCRKESQTFGLTPFGFCGSRRQWVVNPHTRVSGARAVEDNQSSRRLELREPETTAEQPAPVSTKAPGTRDHQGQPAPVSTKVPTGDLESGDWTTT